MSRVIKFRAWNPYVGRMRASKTAHNLLEYPAQCFDYLMQFTGLHDKNGKEIYEGDIVRAFLGKPAVVKFGDYMVNGTDYYSNYATAGFYIDYGNNDDGTSYINASECEVIGNIHETPELLEASK